VPVVKGVSRSVSATTGALDTLDHLGIEVTASPTSVTPLLDRFGIAFVDYRAFCPRFFNRYDGTFAEIQPTSLFMPAAALSVHADGFVHGLASPQTGASLRAKCTVAPLPDEAWLCAPRSRRVTSSMMYATCGTAWRSDLANGAVTDTNEIRAEASATWMADVAHRPTHRAKPRRARSRRPPDDAARNGRMSAGSHASPDVGDRVGATETHLGDVHRINELDVAGKGRQPGIDLRIGRIPALAGSMLDEGWNRLLKELRYADGGRDVGQFERGNPANPSFDLVYDRTFMYLTPRRPRRPCAILAHSGRKPANSFGWTGSSFAGGA
jgi:hypothetical protein